MTHLERELLAKAKAGELNSGAQLSGLKTLVEIEQFIWVMKFAAVTSHATRKAVEERRHELRQPGARG